MEITFVEESRVILERTETGSKETCSTVWDISNWNREEGVNPREYSKVEQVGRRHGLLRMK